MINAQTTLADLTGKVSFRCLDSTKSLQENIQDIGINNIRDIVRELDVETHKMVKIEEDLDAADEAMWKIGVKADFLEIILSLK